MIHIQLYTYTCSNIINHNDPRTYLTHFIRKSCESVAKMLWERWVGNGTETATYWPPVPLTIAALLSHSTGLLTRGSWGPKPSAGSWFSLLRTATRTATNWLQLTRTVCGTGLYNCLISTCFLWASHLHQIQPVHMSSWYLRPDAPVSRLTAGSKVNMLHMDLVLNNPQYALKPNNPTESIIKIPQLILSSKSWTRLFAFHLTLIPLSKL